MLVSVSFVIRNMFLKIMFVFLLVSKMDVNLSMVISNAMSARKDLYYLRNSNQFYKLF